MGNSIGKYIVGTTAFFMLVLSLVIRMINGSQGIISPEDLLNIVSVETSIFVASIIIGLKKWLGSLLKITVVFVIMFCLYMFGQLLLMSINCLSTPFLDGKFSYTECIDSIMDVHTYLAFFLLGLTFAKTYRGHLEYVPDKKGVKVGYWVLVLSLPFYILVVGEKLMFVILYGYASLYQDVSLDAIPSGYKILSYFFMSGVFFLFFSSERKSRDEKIGITLLIIHCALSLAMGYRAQTMTPILLLLYGLQVKRMNFERRKTGLGKGMLFMMAICAFLVLFIFPAVRESRNEGGLSTMSADEIFTNNAIFETVHDMGKSLQTHVYTKQLVPEKYPYRYGYTYLMNLTTAMPNLFWSRHPAEVYGSLGKWLTKIVNYDFYAFGGALGYSCVAEAYINFGYIGIILIAFIFGFTLLSVENKVEYYNSPIMYASLCIVSMYLVSYSRGEFADLVRGFFWYMLIPRLMYKYIRK